MYHKITQKLLSSYRLAKYMFEFDGVEHRINVACTCPFVDQLLAQQAKPAAYFITPLNPFSCPLNAAENTLRNTRFCAEIEAHQYYFLMGYGTDEAEQWERDFSYLIFSDDDDAMQDLAARFGQNAIQKLPYQSPIQLWILESLGYVPS